MHIISGELKGKILRFPSRIRPTSNKVRKALFDIIGEKVVDSCVLDLFAGSGSLGLEALSRGARSVIFVEKDRGCVRIIKENLSLANRLTAEDVSQFDDRLRRVAAQGQETYLLNMDVFKAIPFLFRKGCRFDLVFLDPPYYEGMAKKSLQTFFEYDILKPQNLIVAEHYKKDDLPSVVGNLTLVRQERYGDTVLSFYSAL